MGERCGAETLAGDPCRAWPMEGSTRCVVHQHAEPADPGDEAAVDDDRCGAPTRRGGVCRNHPMAGQDRCHHHIGLDPTEAQERARREGNRKHGSFVTGFLDEDEREHFRRVLEGTEELGELKRHVIAALVIRANRMMRWEAEGEQVSGFATEVFGELRQALESIGADELAVEHSWDVAEVHDQVEAVLEADPELLCRVVPDAAEEAVREALDMGV
jgi:hypothetical protein